MKIVFFGTPYFSSCILEAILNTNFDVKCVITSADSKSGRGKKVKSCHLKNYCKEKNIDYLSPINLSDPQFIKNLESFKADLFVVVAFKKLPKSIFELPKIGTINLHTSLLPDYRGASPINWVLINNEKKTGVSIFFINDKIDQGDIISQSVINLEIETTAAQLHSQMVKVGSELMTDTLNNIFSNKFKTTTQPIIKNLNKAPKINTQITRINWNESLVDINNLTRGLSPYISDNNFLKDKAKCPCAWFFLEQYGKRKRIKIIKSKIETSNNNSNFHIDTDNKTYLKIHSKFQSICLEFLQMEGKRIMSISEFLLGNPIDSKCRFI
tara:strand:+ start:43592 stop:44569 length:978 start_codon:yes stop_codon:yes gene_type:complete